MVRKTSGIFRIIAEHFCENSERLRDINYFCKKNFIIGIWEYAKYVSEDSFFENL